MTRRDLLDYIQQVRSGVDAAVHMVDASDVYRITLPDEDVRVRPISMPDDARRHSFHLLVTGWDWTPELDAIPAPSAPGRVHWRYRHYVMVFVAVGVGDPHDRHFDACNVQLPEPLGEVKSLRLTTFEAIYSTTPQEIEVVRRMKQLFGRQSKGRARHWLLPGMQPEPVPLLAVSDDAMRWFEAGQRRVFDAVRRRPSGEGGLWMKTRKIVGRDGKEREETILTQREPAPPAQRVTGQFAYPVNAAPFWDAAD